VLVRRRAENWMTDSWCQYDGHITNPCHSVLGHHGRARISHHLLNIDDEYEKFPLMSFFTFSCGRTSPGGNEYSDDRSSPFDRHIIF